MKTLSHQELLAAVKETNNITGSFHDKRVDGYIREVQRFVLQAGVPAAVLESDAVVGLIAMGVDSLMETGALSTYVQQRIIQECLTPANEEEANV